MFYRVLTLLVGCVSGTLALAGPGEDRINAFLASIDSMQANFEQTLYDEDLNRLEDSRGVMYLQRPGRFRWDYVEPYPQMIVSNGRTLWLYDSELAQVTVKTLDQDIENIPTMLLSSEEPLENHFDISELPGSDGKVWVELKPKSPDATFSNMRLIFADDDLHSMELVDNFGQTTQIKFFLLRKNPDIDASRFEFIPPDGVDVIGDVVVE